MHRLRYVNFLFAVMLTVFFVAPGLRADEHVVPQAKLHQALMSVTAVRKKNVAQVEQFFSSQPVEKVFKKTGMNLRQVKQAIPALSNRELSQIAQRTQNIQSDFAAGALSNERLTYIVIALATAVIVILIVKA